MTFDVHLFAALHRTVKQAHNLIPISAHEYIPSLHPLSGLSEPSVS
ncbi:hypothetical protein B481_2223 [Planococcus halocryophilus Or1]|nr:hypothetical protein B481_2223 [Planococcus halocryophilus Or1]